MKIQKSAKKIVNVTGLIVSTCSSLMQIRDVSLGLFISTKCLMVDRLIDRYHRTGLMPIGLLLCFCCTEAQLKLFQVNLRKCKIDKSKFSRNL